MSSARGRSMSLEEEEEWLAKIRDGIPLFPTEQSPRVLTALSERWLSIAEIAKAMGVGTPAVSRALRRLHQEGQIERATGVSPQDCPIFLYRAKQ